tara:strand:+ start:3695 stop:3943 length:249 start_codon:yes stop_codon:yes gene_type:complete
MQYRLHIDIPLGTDEDEAIQNAEGIVKMFQPSRNSTSKWELLGTEQVNYRLGHDEDRQKSNYLEKNKNGHVSNRKTRIDISG